MPILRKVVLSAKMTHLLLFVVRLLQLLNIKAGLENAADITQGKTTDNYKAKDKTYVKLGETYSLFGKGYAADPSANPNAAAQAFLTKLEGVSDIALSLDENLKSLYGITIDGTNFTISNEAAYGKRNYLYCEIY